MTQANLCVFHKLVSSPSAAPYFLIRCGSQSHIYLNSGAPCVYISLKMDIPLLQLNACFSPGSAGLCSVILPSSHLCNTQFPAPTQLTCKSDSSSSQVQPLMSMSGWPLFSPWSLVASAGTRHLLSSQRHLF